MTDDAPIPTFTDAEVLDRLRAAAQRGLEVDRKGDNDLTKYGYDIDGVSELLVQCSDEELWKHELSEHYPEKNDYAVVLKIELEEELHPFYVKVALHLPTLESGELVSFHWWGMTR